MKSGLIIVVGSLATVVAAVGFYSYGGSHSVTALPKSSELPTAHDQAAAQLAGEVLTPARQAQATPNEPQVVQAARAPEQSLAPSADEGAGSLDLNGQQGIKAPTHQAPDLEAKYANMSIEDLRAAFANLRSILQEQHSEGPLADKEHPDAVRLPAELVAELEREAAWVKEHAYP